MIDARLLETLDPLGHRWGGKVGASPKLGEGDATVGRQLGDDPMVNLVQ